MADMRAPNISQIFDISNEIGLADVLAKECSVEDAIHTEYSELLLELLHAPSTERSPEFFRAVIDELVRRGRALHLIHLVGRLIRNLAVDELIIGGDCWDRGPGGDRVVDYLRLQPNVAFIWGNHDMFEI